MSEREPDRFFGTESETWVRTPIGLYLIQSPDLQAAFEDHTALGLPHNATELDPAICSDLEIPEEVRGAVENLTGEEAEV